MKHIKFVTLLLLFSLQLSDINGQNIRDEYNNLKKNCCQLLDSLVDNTIKVPYRNRPNDSVWKNTLDFKFFYKSIELLSYISKIENNMSDKLIIEDKMAYNSLSLDKSIYKIDLINFMMYFDCPRYKELQMQTKGNFIWIDSMWIRNSNMVSISGQQNMYEIYKLINDSTEVYGDCNRIDTVYRFPNKPNWKGIDTFVLYPKN